MNDMLGLQCAIVLVAAVAFIKCAGQAVVSGAAVAEWDLQIPGMRLQILASLESEYTPPEGACSGVQDAQVAFQGVYVGMLLKKPNMGDKLVGDIFPRVLADALQSLLHTKVDVEARYVQREPEEPLDGRTCANFDEDQPCSFGVIGGGSMIYKMSHSFARHDIAWYTFATGVENVKTGPPTEQHFHFESMPRHMMGGVRGPITEQLLHVYGRHLPIIRDAGLLGGVYFVEGYADSLARDQDFRGQDVQEIVLSDGETVGVQLPRGRKMILVSLKNNPGNNGYEGQYIDLNSPYVRVYISLVLGWAKEYQVVFQPCDELASKWHRSLQLHVNKLLRAEGLPPVLQHVSFEDYSAVLRLCAQADVSFHARLHSGVMCAAVGIPVVYLSNNVKFIDFLSTLNLTHMRVNVPSETEFNVGALEDTVRMTVAEAQQERNVMSAALRACQRDTQARHVRAMRGWLLARDAKMSHLLARLSCCRQGVTVQQGSITSQRMMNYQIRCS